MTETNAGWKTIYFAGGAAALAAVALGLADIIITMLPGGGTPASGAGSVLDWFDLFRTNSLQGLRGLGLMNAMVQVAMIVLLFSIYGAHKAAGKRLAALAFAFSLLGASVYIANNAALPMLGLSGRYAAATTESQRSMLISAGQAMLARSEDFTPGSLPGFLICESALGLMAAAMLRGKVFGAPTAWAIILGCALLMAFTLGATFVPSSFDAMLPVSMIGGLASMVGFVLAAARLFRLGGLEQGSESAVMGGKDA